MITNKMFSMFGLVGNVATWLLYLLSVNKRLLRQES